MNQEANNGMTEMFMRKFGIKAPLGFDVDCLRDSIEYKELKKMSESTSEFIPTSFSKQICPNLRQLCSKKADESKVILLNSVDISLMPTTEQAFFLAYDPLVEQLSDYEANHLKQKNQQKYNQIIERNCVGSQEYKRSIPKKKAIIGTTREATPIEDDAFQKSQMNKESNEEEKRVYCVCKISWGRGYDENMIMCDGKCKEWYHPSCIHMTKYEQTMIDARTDIFWLCKRCIVFNIIILG